MKQITTLADALRDLLDQIRVIGIPDWHGAEGLSLERADAALATIDAPGFRATPDEIEAARDDYQTDEIEIDDDALASRPDPEEGGCWVSAWVWLTFQVNNPDKDIDES